ncbi:MAG: efflux RND transporter periplasmic adaptor subunit [Croceibacterium sp.]
MTTIVERLTPRQRSYAAAAAIAVVSVAAGYGLATMGRDSARSEPASGCSKVLYWYDPMVPAQHFDKPGKSPMGMEMIARCAGGSAEADGVRIDPALVQNFGVRTVKAEYGVLEPETTVTGSIAYNARQVAIVQPRAGGFVQRTYGRAPQDLVTQGAPIADLLVPEWGGAQREYLAVARTGDQALTSAARERMRLLGMSDGLISSVSRNGRLQATITVTAPVSGAITSLAVRPGMTVSAGQTLAEISGLNPIWLEAAVPEINAGDVRVGQPVGATLTAYPSERFAGRIIAILPSAQADSRTITARIELPNPGLRLRPGMFAQVSLQPARREALLIPSEAVIRTGRRTLVMVMQGKRGYRPAEVRTGREANGKSEILAGLAAGEAVVTSGQFLIDSEASLAGLDVRPIDEVPASGVERAAKQQSDKSPNFNSTGTILAIRPGSVTLDMAALPALKWPKMQMAFAAKNQAQLSGFKSGDRVTFNFTDDAHGPHLVSIAKALR